MESGLNVPRETLYKFYVDHSQLNHYLIQIKNCLNKRNEYFYRINFVQIQIV